MGPFAATATATMTSRGWWALIILATIATASYAASCAWWPFAACPRCKGAGRHARKDGRVWRDCRRCRGSGRRLRIGRRIYNHLKARRES
jgi:hypothetical protein